jgi:hypothetical protein
MRGRKTWTRKCGGAVVCFIFREGGGGGRGVELLRGDGSQGCHAVLTGPEVGGGAAVKKGAISSLLTRHVPHTGGEARRGGVGVGLSTSTAVPVCCTKQHRASPLQIYYFAFAGHESDAPSGICQRLVHDRGGAHPGRAASAQEITSQQWKHAPCVCS